LELRFDHSSESGIQKLKALDQLRIFTRKLKTRRSFSRRMVENHPGKSSGGVGDGELGFHLLAVRMSGKEMGEDRGMKAEWNP
jgi:hypothetical protein